MKKRLLFMAMAMVFALSCGKDDAGSTTTPSDSLDSTLYTISSEADLYTFADSVVLNPSLGAQLSEDIILTEDWTPIETYSGVFKGRGKTISSLKITGSSANVGLFGTLDGATVQDLTLDFEITNTKYYTGALAGFAKNYTTITNCSTTANSTIYSSSYYVGGLVGLSNNTTISGCVNNAAVEGVQRHVGGIVGGNRVSSTVTDSYNTGAVKADDASGRYIGGVVGSNNESAVTSCYNTGEVSGGFYYVGGVVGISETETGLISECYNTANVSSTGSYVGGITGKNYSSAIVENSYNTGSVEGLKSVAGIAGQNEGSTIKDCYNKGVVSDTDADGYVGGISGYSFSSSVISNCYNTAAISAAQYVGGVAGESKESLVINCYNTGDVTAEGNYAGGVVGNNYTSAVVVNCYSIANVSAAEGAGGVSGVNASTAQYYACYSVGTATATTSQGGVIGIDNGATFVDCYYDNLVNTAAADTDYGMLTADMKSSSFVDVLNSTTQYYNSFVSTSTYLACPWVKSSSYPTLNMSGEAEYYKAKAWSISSEADLAAIGTGYYMVSDTYTLTQNITLTEDWTPISEFQGTLDGAGFTISGLKVSGSDKGQGLFVTCTEATIKDLTIDGSVESTSGESVGAFAGYAYYSSFVNCTTTATTTIKGAGNNVAGIVGFSNNSTFEGCTNLATITGTKYAAGITAFAGAVTITNCKNEGSIYCSGYFTGGIAAKAYSESVISSCDNKGDVYGVNNYVGGIVGANNASTVTACNNEGSVEGEIDYIGGIAGYNESASTISKCSNKGAVVGTEDDGDTYCGGISGYNTGSSIIEYSNNTASVKGRGYVGGIVAMNTNSSIVSGCYNIADIVSEGYNSTYNVTYCCVGGIVGRSVESSTIVNCYSIGDITGEKMYIGGVVGTNHSNVINTYSIGDVKSNQDDYIGGLIGYNYQDAYVQSSYCVGSVSMGSGYVIGGFIGTCFNDAVYNCYYNTDKYSGNGVYDSDKASLVTGKTTTEMQDAAFVATLNAAVEEYNATSPSIEAVSWKAGENGYPTLDL